MLRQSKHGLLDLIAGLFVEFFRNSRRSAGQFAKIIQFCLAHVTATLKLDAVYKRTEGLESSLHTHTVRDLTNGKGRVEAAITLADDDSFEGLQSLAIAFLDLDLDNHCVSGAEFGKLLSHLLGFDLFDDLVFAHLAQLLT